MKSLSWQFSHTRSGLQNNQTYSLELRLSFPEGLWVGLLSPDNPYLRLLWVQVGAAPKSSALIRVNQALEKRGLESPDMNTNLSLTLIQKQARYLKLKAGLPTSIQNQRPFFFVTLPITKALEISFPVLGSDSLRWRLNKCLFPSPHSSVSLA